ncbi:MAG TPA: RdgB/HAM1 family non-canonical purine NTP pyrophosphatase, partial [Aquificaceae bacterium]|nr:RdgB/HAM1 family non-canonical purine NTP pyrophosphatase [Aquificaceae bacterium]
MKPIMTTERNELHKNIKIVKVDPALENAYLKAKAYYEKFKMPTVADDSGLIVEAISPYPGIYSSRFYEIDLWGKEEIKESKDEANIRKLLRVLKNEKNRRAKFVAVIVFYDKDKGFFVEGEVKGVITESPTGDKGFGYDPIFIPEGYDRTMAELSPEEKDLISHRGKALRKLYRILKECEKT